MSEVDEGLEVRSGDEGRFAATRQNKAAGRALRAARRETSQAAFADTLSAELGVPVSPTTLSGWETGRRSVPAAVWLAAAVASGQSLDALVGESGLPAVEEWANRLGLPQWMERQTAELQTLKDEVAGLRQQYATLYADVVQTLTQEGVASPQRASRAGDASERPGHGQRRGAG